MIDLHIHDTDFMVHLFGKPRAVTSHGLRTGAAIDALRTTYHYKKSGPLLTSEAGWINAPGLPFEHGYDAFFEKATLHFNSSHSPAVKIYQKSGPKELKLRAYDGFQAELEAAAKAVRSGLCRRGWIPGTRTCSLAVCRAEERSVRSGKTEAI